MTQFPKVNRRFLELFWDAKKKLSLTNLNSENFVTMGNIIYECYIAKGLFRLVPGCCKLADAVDFVNTEIGNFLSLFRNATVCYSLKQIASIVWTGLYWSWNVLGSSKKADSSWWKCLAWMHPNVPYLDLLSAAEGQLQFKNNWLQFSLFIPFLQKLKEVPQ